MRDARLRSRAESLNSRLAVGMVIPAQAGIQHAFFGTESTAPLGTVFQEGNFKVTHYRLWIPAHQGGV